MLFRHAEIERLRDHCTMEMPLWMPLWYVTRHGFSRCESPRCQSYKSKNCQTTQYKAANITARHHGRWPPGRKTIHAVPTNTDAKNQTAQTVRSVLDDNCIIQTPPKEIALAFTIFLRSKYGAINIDASCVRTMKDIARVDNHTHKADCLENPFEPCEMYKALHSFGRNKTLGRDGLGLDFYKAIRATIKDDVCLILNRMFFGGPITSQQKHGTIVCLPKMHKPLTPTDHRQITLLKNDYKVVARILAHRLTAMMERNLKSTQYCGVPENSILDAVATVRDAIAHAEHTNIPLCILTLCLKNSFDRISHSYLFAILHSYGLSPSLINCTKTCTMAAIRQYR